MDNRILSDFLDMYIFRSYCKNIDETVQNDDAFLQKALLCHFVGEKHNYEKKLKEFREIAVVPNKLDSYIFDKKNSAADFINYERLSTPFYHSAYSKTNMTLCMLACYYAKIYPMRRFHGTSVTILRTEPLKMIVPNYETVKIAQNDPFFNRCGNVNKVCYFYNYTPVFFDNAFNTPIKNARQTYKYKFYIDDSDVYVSDKFIAPFGLWKEIKRTADDRDPNCIVSHMTHLTNVYPISLNELSDYTHSDKMKLVLRKMSDMTLASKL